MEGAVGQPWTTFSGTSLTGDPGGAEGASMSEYFSGASFFILKMGVLHLKG